MRPLLDDLVGHLAAAETAEGLELLESLFSGANWILRVGDSEPAKRPVLTPERVGELTARLVILAQIASERLVHPAPETISSGLRSGAAILRACMPGADVDEADIQDQADGSLAVLVGDTFAAARRRRFMDRYEHTYPSEAALAQALAEAPVAVATVH